jgi:hypothetical protein
LGTVNWPFSPILVVVRYSRVVFGFSKGRKIPPCQPVCKQGATRIEARNVVQGTELKRLSDRVHLVPSEESGSL